MTTSFTLAGPSALAREGASLAISGLLALLLAIAVQPRNEPPPPEPAEAISIDDPPASPSEPAPPAQPASVVLPPPPPSTQAPAEASTPEPPAAATPAPVAESMPEPSEPPVEPPEPAVVPDREPAAATEPEPQPATREPATSEPAPVAEAPAEPAVQQTLGRQDVERGRPLLMLLESGQGPTISIDWPEQALARDRLAERLEQCYGVELALLSADGALYRMDDWMTGPAGGAVSFDLDRWSGFLRMPSGQLSRPEQQRAAALRDRYAVPGTRIVRLFPRSTDAALLGGLGSVLGERYQSASAIRLAYELTDDPGAPVGIRLISVDDEPGTLRLGLPARQRCQAG